MKRIRKTAALICIISTLLMSCYSSALIAPTGENRKQISSGRIDYVVTRDSAKYVFDKPPTIAQDSIVGKVDTKQVSIPISDVAMVSMMEKNWVGVAIPAVIVGVMAAAAVYLAVGELARWD